MAKIIATIKWLLWMLRGILPAVARPSPCGPAPAQWGVVARARAAPFKELHARGPRGSHATVDLDIEHAGQDEHFPRSSCLSIPWGVVLGHGVLPDPLGVGMLRGVLPCKV